MWPFHASSRMPADAGSAQQAASAASSSGIAIRRIVGFMPGSFVMRACYTEPSRVVPDFHAVAILHPVLASFQPQHALLAGLRVSAQLHELLVGDDFGANESARQVGM